MQIVSLNFKAGANELRDEVAIMSGVEIAEKTPIDTGRASGNWQASVGAPILTESGRLFPSSSFAQIVGAISVANTKDKKIFISNNVPYIRRLNLGWSQQQPTPFWIERILRKVSRQIIKRTKLTTRMTSRFNLMRGK
jgi:hypothetical protein